ncbi:hypothetical protein [Stakelama pacifica]|uniref:hypothetical protein n=1 Tax=Stakelama pacifica TaxID=517720 RepID=UPI001E56A0F4|nr:hypothetical protein [Stakelama pacifica]
MPNSPAAREAAIERAKRPSEDAYLKAQINQSARVLIDFVTENRATDAFEFPFSHSYPRNCCESVSMIFSYLLEDKYALPDVTIIRGTKPRLHEHHFWVRAAGSLYDLTAQQFPGRLPILGVERHALFASFPEHRAIHEHGFVDREEVLALHRAGVIPF